MPLLPGRCNMQSDFQYALVEQSRVQQTVCTACATQQTGSYKVSMLSMSVKQTGSYMVSRIADSLPRQTWGCQRVRQTLTAQSQKKDRLLQWMASTGWEGVEEVEEVGMGRSLVRAEVVVGEVAEDQATLEEFDPTRLERGQSPKSHLQRVRLMSLQVQTELQYPLDQGCWTTLELLQVQSIAGGLACCLHSGTDL